MAKQVKGQVSDAFQKLMTQAESDGRALATQINDRFMSSLKDNLYFNCQSWVAHEINTMAEEFRSDLLADNTLNGNSTNYLESAD